MPAAKSVKRAPHSHSTLRVPVVKRPFKGRLNLDALGVTPLAEGEGTYSYRVRAHHSTLDRFGRMTAAERGAWVTRAYQVLDALDAEERSRTASPAEEPVKPAPKRTRKKKTPPTDPLL